MGTYEELFLLGTLIVSIITLIDKKKITAPAQWMRLFSK